MTALDDGNVMRRCGSGLGRAGEMVEHANILECSFHTRTPLLAHGELEAWNCQDHICKVPAV